ncbi:hypothetical protein LOAG_03735 [Loa loa]|uniref:Uncharacterized protein n=1 Tax=Loa loa TaxID=7209 RepID=A0A1S0U3Z7_LOALO|nr:hypothetical protein LOAG_03735 [Loa loa]EFO24752.1 hypothetical protein LOAG_03735 [Loa loa]
MPQRQEESNVTYRLALILHPSNNSCYLLSWYLTTDFQLQICAPILLIPLVLKPMLGYITASLIILFSTAANWVTVYKEYFLPTNFYMDIMDARMSSYISHSFLICQAPWIRFQLTNIICWSISEVFVLAGTEIDHMLNGQLYDLNVIHHQLLHQNLLLSFNH